MVPSGHDHEIQIGCGVDLPSLATCNKGIGMIERELAEATKLH